MSGALAGAVSSGLIGGRLWLYANYHCNLACRYCLTESAPGVPRRQLPLDRLPEVAREARANGFTALGVTGGEPFLVRGLPAALAAMAAELPVVVLSNGTLFNRRLLAELAVLSGREVAVQISLDSADPDANDEMRAPLNFAKVVGAIPRLRELGLRVRIATTTEGLPPDELRRLAGEVAGDPDAAPALAAWLRDHGFGVEEAG